VLVDGGEHPVFGQRGGHFESAHSIHVGRYDGDTAESLLRVAESNLPVEINIRPAFQRAAFGSKKNIFEVEFNIGIDSRHFVCFSLKKKNLKSEMSQLKSIS